MKNLGDLETGGAIFEVALAAAGGTAVPPAWVQLTPRGTNTTRDGRTFRFDPEKLAAAFVAGGVNLPIDFDHETEFTSTLGARPARGWIVAMEARPEGLFGQVEWLADAISALSSRAYRYISPTFWRDADGVGARMMKGAALVTSPALGLPSLASAESTLHDPVARMVASQLGLDPSALQS